MVQVAVDAGQSRTRAVVIGPDGTLSGRGEAEGVIHLGAPGGPMATANATVAAIREAIGDGPAPTGAVIAISGWPTDASLCTDLIGRLSSAIRISHISLTSDAVAGFFASPQRDGLVSLAAGTGSVAIAADGSGAWALADGKGHLLGDCGSGFWIGQRGLAAALATSDGRCTSHALLQAAGARFGDPARIPDLVYGALHPVSVIAGFAPDVIAAAAAGDAVAEAIVRGAGMALARTADAAATRVFGDAPVTVALTGGLATGTSPLVDAFLAALHTRRPGAAVLRHELQPLDGAAFLAREPWHLARWFPGLVCEAGR